jgi:hypothetical protein
MSGDGRRKCTGYLLTLEDFQPFNFNLRTSDFGLFADKEAGVTRNVIVCRSGKIIFLTRLFEREEFNRMKKAIFTELASK